MSEGVLSRGVISGGGFVLVGCVRGGFVQKRLCPGFAKHTPVFCRGKCDLANLCSSKEETVNTTTLIPIVL